jgi:hypothetical protein
MQNMSADDALPTTTTNNTATSSGEESFTLIHYAALPPDKGITTEHVHQILGVGNHSTELVDKTVEKLTKLKHDVRSWAASQIRSKMAEIARALGNDEFTAKVLYNNNPVNSFAELKKWWMQQCSQEDPKARNSLYYIAYGYFEECPTWDVYLEQEYMKTMKLGYITESAEAIQGKNKRKGYEIKGCIARNVVMVKHELVKQLQKAGRAIAGTVSFTKNRPKDKTVDSTSKRRKKGEYYFGGSDMTSPAKQHIKEKVSNINLSPCFMTSNLIRCFLTLYPETFNISLYPLQMQKLFVSEWDNKRQ